MMRIKTTILLFIICLFSFSVKSQSKCDYIKNIADSIDYCEEPTKSAEFVGGERELVKYLNSIQLDVDEDFKGIPSKIVIKLLIYQDGEVSVVEINEKNPNEDKMNILENSLMTELKKMPNWISAKCGNEKVNSFITINKYINLK